MHHNSTMPFQWTESVSLHRWYYSVGEREKQAIKLAIQQGHFLVSYFVKLGGGRGISIRKEPLLSCLMLLILLNWFHQGKSIPDSHSALSIIEQCRSNHFSSLIIFENTILRTILTISYWKIPLPELMHLEPNYTELNLIHRPGLNMSNRTRTALWVVPFSSWKGNSLADLCMYG